MPISRFVLSAIVLIITNLIVGSISLSLGLIILVLTLGVTAIAVVLLAALGLGVMLEKANRLPAGWTDARIERFKTWAKRKWHETPGWYREQKRRIIDMLIEMLKGKEAPETEDPRAMIKSILTGLAVLVGIVLVKGYLKVPVGWAIVIVALAFAAIAVPLAHVKGKRNMPEDLDTSKDLGKLIPLLSDKIEANPEEIAAAIKELVELHRSGRLEQMTKILSDIPGKPAF